MGEFREEFQTAIRSVLTGRNRLAADFEIAGRVKDNFSVLRITYAYHSGFAYEIQVRTHESRGTVLPGILAQDSIEAVGTIHVFASPGEILRQEHRKFSRRPDLLHDLGNWVDRIDAELRAIPLNRQVEEQRRQIEELTARFSTTAEGYFSVEEAAQLKTRLDDFEQSLAESIRRSSEDSKETAQRISVLHTEVEALKAQLAILDKKGWTKSALVRIAHWFGDPLNRELLKSGTDLATSLLLPPGSSEPQ